MTSALSHSIPLSRHWLARAADAVSEVFAHAVQGFRRTNTRPSSRRARQEVPEWTVEDLAALNDGVLRDIGVPDWAREEAAARREHQRATMDVRVAAGELFGPRW